MTRARFPIVSRLAAAAAVSLAFIHLANAPEIGLKVAVAPPPTSPQPQPLPQQQQSPAVQLATNPKLLRQLPSAGWIAEHSASWVADHAVYQETCQSAAVVDEVRYLNRVIGYDEYLINVTQAYMKSAAAERDDTGVKQADFAAGRIDRLRSDVAVADGLAVRLQALPACADDVAQVASAEDRTSPAAAATLALPASASDPPPVSASSLPPAPAVLAAATGPTTGEPQPTPPSASPQPRMIRFDPHLPALTPSGLRALHEAVAASLAGEPVQLAVEGCDAAADWSKGSACEQRRQALMAMLADSGISHPRRLVAVAAAQ